jgi:hypothetical protein
MFHAMSELDQLRFPVGRFHAAASSTPESRAAQIETIRLLPEQLKKAVAGLTDAQLDTPYREDGWTLRQVVHHIADSHANAFIRFKLALTEAWPTAKPYNQAAWAKLADSKMPIAPSLAMADGIHTRWAALLASLTDADFARGFNHPENGKVDLATALAMYDWHARHHLAHITGLKTRKGW